jgi:hypothetical protein
MGWRFRLAQLGRDLRCWVIDHDDDRDFLPHCRRCDRYAIRREGRYSLRWILGRAIKREEAQGG